jgi:phosphoenolpyruvate synthase/pyruvate phosphate dikinase
MTPNKPLTKWLADANAEQIKALAKLVPTSVATLRHIAVGRRQASAAFAVDLERASRALRKKEDTPILYQDDLCKACKKCAYLKQCNEAVS